MPLELAVLTLLASQGAGTPAAELSGSTRHSFCRLDTGPVQPCLFTRLFGDGSFDVRLSATRRLRLVLGDGNALLFVGVGPGKQIGMPGVFRRDKRDPACWISDASGKAQVEDGPPKRICVYRSRPLKRPALQG